MVIRSHLHTSLYQFRISFMSDYWYEVIVISHVNIVSACSKERYGSRCQHQCLCENGAPCDPNTGRCLCSPGWVGATCSQPCPNGRYGNNCTGICQVLNGATCDHVTGSLICAPGFIGLNCELREYKRISIVT